jgi:gamma-glutamylcyclotransferase (GGCT)/AIG2-like uncharacterized protein YtfP
MQNLFVYGSLKPGRSRWPSLQPFVDEREPVREAWVRGELWESPWGWPVVTTGHQLVPGLVVVLDGRTLTRALEVLDGFEGTESGLFSRVQVVTEGGTRCWMYLWPHATEGFEALAGAR